MLFQGLWRDNALLCSAKSTFNCSGPVANRPGFNPWPQSSHAEVASGWDFLGSPSRNLRNFKIAIPGIFSEKPGIPGIGMENRETYFWSNFAWQKISILSRGDWIYIYSFTLYPLNVNFIFKQSNSLKTWNKSVNVIKKKLTREFINVLTYRV